MSVDQTNCAPEDQSTGVELTYNELCAIADAFAWTDRKKLNHVHGEEFIQGLRDRLTAARMRVLQ